MGRDEGHDRGVRKGRCEVSAAQNGQHKGAVAELPAVELRGDEGNDAEILLGVAVGHRRSRRGIDDAGPVVRVGLRGEDDGIAGCEDSRVGGDGVDNGAAVPSGVRHVTGK